MPYLVQNPSLYYEQHGKGPAILLIHGIAASFAFNFTAFGWVEQLTSAGFSVIGIDLRGHGNSEKPLEPSAYGMRNLCNDVVAVLDELNLEQASIIGYSLGSAIALNLLHKQPERFRSAVLMATGDGLIGVPPYIINHTMPNLAEVLSHNEYPKDLPAHSAVYWSFVEQSGGGRQAIHAATKADYPFLPPAKAAQIQIPIMVISAETDPVLGQGQQLADTLANGRYLEIAGEDHFTLAASKLAKESIVKFLQE